MSLTPQQAELATLGFCVAVTAIVVGYDVLAYRAWGVDATISRVFRRLFEMSPATMLTAAFWCGIFFGHVWFRD